MPIGLLALVVGWIRLPPVSGHDVPVPNFWAAALITTGIATLTFGIVKLNDWGWNAPAITLSFATAIAALALFVAHCLRSDNPFVHPALFRIPDFTRATLVMTPFSIAFGGFLLSLVLWEQGVWHWSAMKIGLAIAPGPFMVPVTSLLLAGRLITRFGAATVAAAGLVVFTADVVAWAMLTGSHPDLEFAVLCMIPSGIGVGLALPTLMGLGTSMLPASSFATGSGVINMVRQIGLAVGVAIFVAIVGSPGSAEAYRAAFRLAWWVMAVITALGLLPLLLPRQWTHIPAVMRRPFTSSPTCETAENRHPTENVQRVAGSSMSDTHNTAKTRFTEVNSVRYAYRRFGTETKTPIVFLQHFRGGLDHWDPKVTDVLAKDRPVILFNNAGVASSGGEAADTVAGMAGHVIAFLNALGLKRVDLLGFSLGGFVAQQVVTDRPDLIRRVILAGTGPQGGERV